MMPPAILALAAIVLLAHTGEVITGFGATLVSLSLGAHIYPLEELVPVLVIVNTFPNAYVAVRHRGHIAKALVLRRILPFMGGGLLIGLILYPVIRGVALKQLLGLMVVTVSARELLFLLTRSPASGRALSGLGAGAWQILGGIAHAFYATGGPPLVYSLSRLALPKAVFRATLCAVWVILNALLVLTFSLNGRISAASLELAALLFPVLPVGIFLGEWLHRRIQEKHFRWFIYTLLLASGVRLLV